MGYGYYTLPDGREAGYGVEAECDATGCAKKIDRGLGYLCGDNPDGWRDEDEPGCGNYYCGDHTASHDCPKQDCGKHEADGELYCGLVLDHDGPHVDPETHTAFTRVEED